MNGGKGCSEACQPISGNLIVCCAVDGPSMSFYIYSLSTLDIIYGFNFMLLYSIILFLHMQIFMYVSILFIYIYVDKHTHRYNIYIYIHVCTQFLYLLKMVIKGGYPFSLGSFYG